MSWKTEQEEEKLRHCSHGVINGQSRAGSAFAPCPQLSVGFCSPIQLPPRMGMGPHSPRGEGQGKGTPAARGRGWETRGVWRAGNCFPSAFKAGL